MNWYTYACYVYVIFSILWGYELGNAKKMLYFTFFILLNQHRPRKARAFTVPPPQKHAQLPVACASCCCCFSLVLAFLCIGCRAEQSRAGSGVGGAMSKIYLAHLQQEQQQQQQQWVQGVLVVAIVCSCHVPGLLLCGSVAVRFGWVRFAAPIV